MQRRRKRDLFRSPRVIVPDFRDYGFGLEENATVKELFIRKYLFPLFPFRAAGIFIGASYFFMIVPEVRDWDNREQETIDFS